MHPLHAMWSKQQATTTQRSPESKAAADSRRRWHVRTSAADAAVVHLKYCMCRVGETCGTVRGQRERTLARTHTLQKKISSICCTEVFNSKLLSLVSRCAFLFVRISLNAA